MDTTNTQEKLIKRFSEYITEQLKEAKDQVMELESILADLNKGNGASLMKALAHPPSQVNQSHPINDGYKINWTWQQKISHILEKGNFTTSEITAKILEYEPSKIYERAKIVASVSAILSVQSKNEDSLYIKSKNERNQNVYGVNPNYELIK